MRNYSSQSGVSLVEVLISMMIIATSLLSLGYIQGKAMQGVSDAFQRSQATWLAYEMLDRMRANYDGQTAYSGTEVGEGKAPVSDPGTVTSAATRAQKDIYEWQENIKSAGGKAGLNKAIGTISKSGDAFVVEVSWLGGMDSSELKTRKVSLQVEYGG